MNAINKNYMEKWVIRDREAGNIIDCFISEVDAKITLKSYEQQDYRDGVYTPNFYEVAYIG